MNDVFKALADPTRREILRTLRSGEHSAGDLADQFNLAKSTLSGHFAVLKTAKLVITEKRGTTVMYKLNSSVFEEAMTHLLEIFSIGEDKIETEGEAKSKSGKSKEKPQESR